MTVPLTLPGFHVMVKPRGAICNLDCRYCYFLKKEQLYPGSDFRMSPQVLETYIRQYIAAQQTPEITFTWQGGEPTLMGLAFYRQALALQAQYRRPGTRIHNALQTNGVSLTPEWCQFFRQHGFLIGVSLDGPAALHDAYRVDKGGAPTFDRVLKGIRLLQEHGVEFNLLCTVHAANAGHPLQVYRFFRDEIGAAFLQFIPIVERDNASGFQEGSSVTARSVTGESYGRFLIALFDEWVRRDVGRVYVQIFEEALAAWVGRGASLCIFRETCGDALALEHNGDLYACDHYVEPNYYLGNVQAIPLLEMASSEQQQAFGAAKRDTLPRFCRECPVRFICNGGCPKNRILHTPDGEPGLNYLCAGYKALFTHIDGPMRFMAAQLRAGRPAAAVMAYMAEQDAAWQSRLQGARRNDSCPCGSGLKLKHCHGRAAAHPTPAPAPQPQQTR